ncbi:MAG: hypothetical protein JSS75_07445 [Bacteroidetes bacterium]|nr:hypothetical protein [Bacteroidota bacterium]
MIRFYMTSDIQDANRIVNTFSGGPAAGINQEMVSASVNALGTPIFLFRLTARHDLLDPIVSQWPDVDEQEHIAKYEEWASAAKESVSAADILEESIRIASYAPAAHNRPPHAQ